MKSGRSGARDRHAVAVDHEAVGDHLHLGMGGGEVFEVLPMHGGAVAVEKAGPGHHPRGGVDPADQRKRGAMRRRSRISGRVATSARR
jgi:hypothetical protein